jgi:hypothetical protein
LFKTLGMAILRWFGVVILMVAGAELVGCSTPKTFPGPNGIVYTEQKNLQRVWIAEQFNFTGYDAVYVSETQAQVAPMADDLKAFVLAKKNVRDECAAAIQQTGLFTLVTTRQTDIPQGAKTLTLNNYITEFRKGSSAPRYAAGQSRDASVIKVHGQFLDGRRLLFDFESRKTGEPQPWHAPGGFMQDEDIQLPVIRSLAKHLAEYMSRTARRK